MSTADFLIVMADGVEFAIPLDRVLGINEPAPVTPIPFAPSYVSGLASVHGAVAMVVDLGLRLGVRPVQSGFGKFVSVRDRWGTATALSVERCGRLLRAPVLVAHADPALDATLVHTAIQIAGGGLVPVLDVSALVDEADADDEADAALLCLDEATAMDSAAPAPDRPRLNSALVVCLSGQEFALPLSDVEEVLKAESLLPVPAAPAGMLGLASLRHSLVMVVDPVHLFGLDVPPVAWQGAAVIMLFVGMRVALAVDRVIGLRAFSGEASGGQALIAEDGTLVRRLRAMDVDDGQLAAVAEPFLDLAMIDAAEFNQVERRDIITFRIGTDRFGLDIGKVRRVAPWQRPEALPGCDDADGAVNVLGQVLPVMDMRRSLFGTTLREDGGAYVVAELGGESWALTVDAVERVESIPVTAIELLGSSGRIGAVVRQNGTRLWLLSPDWSRDAA